MPELKDLYQSADWKIEKHIPVIEAPESVKRGTNFKITVCVGKEIPHPNTTEHHIRWIEIYFFPDAEKFPYQVARVEFNAHGESIQGPNTSSVYTLAVAVVELKTDKAGYILASCYCNIHGLWQNSKRLSVG